MGATNLKKFMAKGILLQIEETLATTVYQQPWESTYRLV